MKQFSCGDVVPGCKAVFQAEDEPGILAQVADHARIDHGMEFVPAPLVEEIRGWIKPVPARSYPYV